MTEPSTETADERELVTQTSNGSKVGDPDDPTQTPEPDTDLTDEVAE